MSRSSALALSLILASASLACPAWAQNEASPGVTAYDAGFFADIQPSNALDMVRQLPGFRLQSGNSSVRGYAGGAGNMLVDGQRPTSKEQSLESVLQRIPAEAVERIELIRAGAPGADMQGFPLLANVVRNDNADLRGRLEAEEAGTHYGTTLPKLAADLTWQGDGQSLDTSLLYYRDLDYRLGFGTRQRFDGGGAPLRDAEYDSVGQVEHMQASTAYRRMLWDGEVTANAVVKNRRWYADTAERPILPLDGGQQGKERNYQRNAELQAQYEVPLSESQQLSLFASHRTGEETVARAYATASRADRTQERRGSRESILRAAWRQDTRYLAVEAGAEGAVNILNSRSSLWQNETPAVLPAANVRIAEQRGEAFVTGNLRLSRVLSTELGMRYETSTLTQSGDSNLVKDLSFAKPRALATWRMTPDSDLRLLAERTAGQLSFSNFVSSASVVNDTVKAGNKNLEPDRTTRLEVSLEQRFWDRGAVTVTLRRENVTAVVDHMPIFDEGDMYDAIGNIGNGRRDVLQANLTLPMDRMALDGVTIQAAGNLRHTKVDDPSTGLHRPFSGAQPFDGWVSLTHDLPDMGVRWGTTYSLRDEERYYMASEFERTIEPGRLEAFVEYKPEGRWTMKVFGRRMLQTPVIRERAVYDGLRGTGPLAYTENRALNTGMVVGVNIQRSFAY